MAALAAAGCTVLHGPRAPAAARGSRRRRRTARKRLTLLLPAARHLRGAPNPASELRVKKKAALSPLLPFPASARTSPLPPAPPAEAPLPWKPSGFARISPPSPLAILQYRGKAGKGTAGEPRAGSGEKEERADLGRGCFLWLPSLDRPKLQVNNTSA